MAILKYILPLLMATGLTGCYENFDPQVDTKPVLCLNSLITAGEPIEVKVSHTWMFNDKISEETHDVSDATVTIFANDIIVDKEYIPREGDRIRIIADSPVYGEAMAEVAVPHAVNPHVISVTTDVTDMWVGDFDFFQYEMLADITFNLKIEMEVDDQPGTDNYFRFGYDWSDKWGTYNQENSWSTSDRCNLSIGTFDYDAEPIFKEHIGVFETVMGNDEYLDDMFFTDRQFRDKTYTLHLNFSRNTFKVQSQEYDESLLDCRLNLYLYSISQSFYNWSVYKWNVDEGVLGDLSDIGLAESRWGYSNVSTGAGVVAAQSSLPVTIDLKEFLKKTLDRSDR